MIEYNNDNWVVLKFSGNDPHYRVLAGYSGGYITGNSWRLNSGITKVEEDEAFFCFHSSSGSRYRCNKDSYMLMDEHCGYMGKAPRTTRR